MGEIAQTIKQYRPTGISNFLFNYPVRIFRTREFRIIAKD